MACFQGVNGPTWSPITINLLFIITILIYFYWIKLLLIFTFWCFACWLILHKRIIFIHWSVSFTLMWVPKGLGMAYADDHAWKWEFYLF